MSRTVWYGYRTIDEASRSLVKFRGNPEVIRAQVVSNGIGLVPPVEGFDGNKKAVQIPRTLPFYVKVEVSK